MATDSLTRARFELTEAGRLALVRELGARETTREHIANALQILNCRALAPLDERELVAIESRLRTALAVMDREESAE